MDTCLRCDHPAHSEPSSSMRLEYRCGLSPTAAPSPSSRFWTYAAIILAAGATTACRSGSRGCSAARSQGVVAVNAGSSNGSVRLGWRCLCSADEDRRGRPGARRAASRPGCPRRPALLGRSCCNHFRLDDDNNTCEYTKSIRSCCGSGSCAHRRRPRRLSEV